MKLIVGIGNPGVEYDNTRHNVGFMAIDQFLKDSKEIKDTVWQVSNKFKADILEMEWQRKKQNIQSLTDKSILEKIILVKPKTYMNNSGLAVSLIANFYRISTSDIWVLHDDVDFPIGTLKIREGGASAGHRGIKSIIESLGSDMFWRFRIGIGRPREMSHSGVEHYVLNKFDHQDHSKIREVLKRVSKAVALGLEKDLYSAMNKFNSN